MGESSGVLFDVCAGVLAEPEAAQVDEPLEVADLVEMRYVVLADEQLLERPAVLEVAQAVYFVDAKTDEIHLHVNAFTQTNLSHKIWYLYAGKNATQIRIWRQKRSTAQSATLPNATTIITRK